MKFQLTLKDPDGIFNGLRDGTWYLDLCNENKEERAIAEEKRLVTMITFVEQWLEFGEYATIEFDTNAGTATLVPAPQD